MTLLMRLKYILLFLLPSMMMAKAPELHLTSDQPPVYLDPKSSKQYMDPAMGFPHSDWQREGMPIGNGRIGAMVFGDPLAERIQFNDISLWTGGANESGKYSVDEPGGFGSYQNFGNLFITMQGIESYENYSRQLDLATGIHTTRWTSKGVTYAREVFASHPDDCIVIRITTDKPTTIKADLFLEPGQNIIEPVPQTSDTLLFGGSLSNGLKYSAKVVSISGTVSKNAKKPQTTRFTTSGEKLEFRLFAATDYAMDPAKNFRSKKSAWDKVEEQVEKASSKNYQKLRADHVADFKKLMGRVELSLGAPPEGLSLPQRLKRYRTGEMDAHLEMLLFQYGRYLLISSSRNSLPANLQGLWNDMNHPAWYCDYHTNINIQMNYWPVEVANLSECAMPLFNWIEASIPGSRAATKKEFGDDTPGWTMRTSVNIYGGNGWEWNLPSSAWFAMHYWEHYAFTGDETFLRERAWPIFEDVSKFWLQKLIEKDGKLVVPDGWSPEHGPREDGPAHDQQIVWALFTHTLDAAKVLGIDNKLTADVQSARKKLLGPQVGTWGQIKEWVTERPVLEKSQHRHTSHLFAVYPGNQITLTHNPELARAAQISLAARGNAGDSRRSWTWGWRSAMWARLGLSSPASDMIRGQLTWNTLPNLLATHPPFQFDGNAGITAGICEMLVQSHAGEISLLPAIPLKRKWRSGSFHGLVARGGFEVAASWDKRTITSASIDSKLGNSVVLRMPLFEGDSILVTPQEGADAFPVDRSEYGTFSFKTKAGTTYDISW